MKLKGQYLRSKIKWMEDGEKQSKYSMNLELRNYKSKKY